MIDSLKTRKRLAAWLERDVRAMHGRIEIEIDPADDVDPADQFDSAEALAHVREQIASGDPWAWCHVTVTVRHGDYSATWNAHVPCSYASEQDFRDNSGYFDDMVRCCCVDIVAQLFAARETLTRMWELANV